MFVVLVIVTGRRLLTKEYGVCIWTVMQGEYSAHCVSLFGLQTAQGRYGGMCSFDVCAGLPHHLQWRLALFGSV